MRKIFIFKYCEGDKWEKETISLTVPALSMRDAVIKFRSMIKGEVFIKEIKEEIESRNIVK
jgi:hypothetical protein